MEALLRAATVADGVLRRTHSLGARAPCRAARSRHVRINVPPPGGGAPHSAGALQGALELHSLDAMSLGRVLCAHLVFDELLDERLLEAGLRRWGCGQGGLRGMPGSGPAGDSG